MSGELVEVYRTSRRYEAELVRSVLESSGIEVTIFGTGLDAAYPSALPDTRVMVNEADAERAREVIESADDVEGDAEP